MLSKEATIQGLRGVKNFLDKSIELKSGGQDDESYETAELAFQQLRIVLGEIRPCIKSK